MVIQLRVIGPAKREILVDVCENQEQMKKVTVEELKKKIIDKLGISQDNDLRLVFTTETLEDSRLLSSYGIQHMSTIHSLLRQPGGQQQLKVILPTRSEKVLDLCDTQEQMKKMTVMDVKKRMTDKHWIGLSTDLRLVFGTQTLEDLQLLSSYGIKHMSTIRTLLRVAGGTC